MQRRKILVHNYNHAKNRKFQETENALIMLLTTTTMYCNKRTKLHFHSLPAGVITPIHDITQAVRTSSRRRANPLLQISWSRRTMLSYPCNLDVVACCTSSILKIWVTQTLWLITLWVPCVLWDWRDKYTSSCWLGWDRCIYLWWMGIGSLWSQANPCLVHMSWILKPTCTIFHKIHEN